VMILLHGTPAVQRISTVVASP